MYEGGRHNDAGTEILAHEEDPRGDFEAPILTRPRDDGE